MKTTIKPSTLLIYISQITPRIEYIVDVIFGTIIRVDHCLISDSELFKAHKGPKVCYHTDKISDSVHVCPISLLFENGIYDQKENIGIPFIWDGVKVLYKTKEGDFPFDVFAASFFVVSRYEEYLKIRKDRYGRFSASSSIAYKYGFIKEPIVHIWTIRLVEFIKEKYPDFEFTLNKYRHQPTIDIDNAWAYKNRGLRTYGMIIKSLFTFKLRNFSKITSVLSGQKQDPYDNYDLLESIHGKSELKPIFFFLFSRLTKYDKGISTGNTEFKNLIRSIASKYDVGIHPSYVSNSRPEKIAKEKSELSNVVGKEITSSRQHYIKIKFPETYRALVKAGIEADYTMGFASKIGFRAGVCEPFLFFDVERNQVTNLTVYPFQIMDVTLASYMGLRPSAAMDEIQKIRDSVKKVGGMFVTLWHNESLSDGGRWHGWRKVYESLFDKP